MKKSSSSLKVFMPHHDKKSKKWLGVSEEFLLNSLPHHIPKQKEGCDRGPGYSETLSVTSSEGN